ncbi:hypothetical protein CASFOL_007841 [Castilleja foliolosa]|uniref:Uncharacterized protein n=1 Tax=Castilleja foliolosa TaxID=1961234 RepID=A0ABD3E294_9LAMI
MMLEHILVLSAYLFSIGIYGLITSRNMVRALMCLELILNSVNINFVTFSDIFDNRQLRGDIFSIFLQFGTFQFTSADPDSLPTLLMKGTKLRIKSFFLEPYEEKTSYTVLGGVLFIYIYPNEPSIESLQLMFDPEEKEKIFKKWAFMIQ